jgi:hypothetical protein
MKSGDAQCIAAFFVVGATGTAPTKSFNAHRDLVYIRLLYESGSVTFLS